MVGSARVDAPADAHPFPAAVGRLSIWFHTAAVLAFISNLIVRASALPWGARFAIALLPVPALVGLMVAVRRIGPRLDELERRIQLEAIATAFAVAAIAFIAYGQFQAAAMLGPEDWIFPWLAIYFGYIFGVLSARRRYQ